MHDWSCRRWPDSWIGDSRAWPYFIESLFRCPDPTIACDRLPKGSKIVAKLNFKKTCRELFYPPKDRFVEIEVPRLTFAQVDGAGDPNTAKEYRTAVEWLYGVSYGMKFAAKDGLQRDYVVPPLEALWWADDPKSFVRREKDRWRWTVMIMAPDFVTEATFNQAVARTGEKRG